MDDQPRAMASLINHSLDNMLRKISSEVFNLKILTEMSDLSPDVDGQVTGQVSAKLSSRVRHPDFRTGNAAVSDKLERFLAEVGETAVTYSQRFSPSKIPNDKKDLALQKFSGYLQGWTLNWQDVEMCKIKSGDFTLPKQIGRGRCCTIYKAQLRILKCDDASDVEFVEVAAKSFDGRPTSKEVCESFLTEACILHTASHPCIIGFFGAYWPHLRTLDSDCGGGWPKPLIVLELMSGNLAELWSAVQMKGRVVQVLRDVGEALAHLHHSGVVHMDIKPENVLVNVDSSGEFVGRAKVTDFGVSRREGASPFDLGQARATALGGTLEFLAPEALGERGKATRFCDVWSFGALMCWLLHACDGGRRDSPKRMCDIEVIAAVCDGSLRSKWLNRLVGCNVDENLRELAAECLSMVPGDRPCMQDVCLALEYHEAGMDRAWIKRIRGKSKDVVLECGLSRYFGVHGTRYQVEAGKWFQFAGDMGSVEAEYILNVAFAMKDGVAQPRKDIYVIHDIHRQIEMDPLGNAGSGEYLLAMFYRHGVTVKADDEQAVKLLTEAVEGGNACARAELGLCYLYGQCVRKDMGRAMELLEEAADRGNARAQYALGYCIEHGLLGRRRRWSECMKLYEAAANAGYSAAKERLDAVRTGDM